MKGKKQKRFKGRNAKLIMANVLSKEIETYEKNKQKLLKESHGKFALIKSEEIINVFDTSADAIKVGIDKFGNTPFLVKQILEIEPTQNFTSNLIRISEPCHQ